MTAQTWVDAWTAQLEAVNCASDVRTAHKWLWDRWSKDGLSVVRELNTSLGLQGDYRFRGDYPHFIAGNVRSARVLFVNINPGWHSTHNKAEDGIVSQSECRAWAFAENLFVEYPVFAPMRWWSQAIGLAWRIVHGTDPKLTAADKRKWACANVAGWELIPLHSSKANFWQIISTSPATPLKTALRDNMRASLSAARRVQNQVLLAHSQASFELLDPGPDKGWGTREAGAATVHLLIEGGKMTVALRQPVVSRYSGIRFLPLARAIRAFSSQRT